MVRNPQSGINYSQLSPGVTVEVTCKDLDRYGQGISFRSEEHTSELQSRQVIAENN